LKREGHQVHILVRPRFKAALEGAPIDRVHLYETRKILEPLLNQDSLEGSVESLSRCLDSLAIENFDRIVNLSFSPVSSWIVRELELREEAKDVRGYSRHPDGALSIPDDGAAYFFAQVGFNFSTPARPQRGINRIPLPHLFGAVTGVELTEKDWALPSFVADRSDDSMRAAIARDHGLSDAAQRRIVLHVGTSESHKSVRPRDWGRILMATLDTIPEDVLLVGSADETSQADIVLEALPERLRPRVQSLVGKTTFRELWSVVRSAEYLLAADSVVAQMAAFVGRPM